MTDDRVLVHYGTPRHSGRYPWGSGQDPEQHSRSLLSYVDEMKKKGLSEPQIAEGLGLKTTQLRAQKTIALNTKKAADRAQAQRLQEKGMSNSAIGRQMNINESSVRALLNPAETAKKDIINSTARMLRDRVGESNLIDIGVGTENHLSLSKEKLAAAVAVLQEEGYEVRTVQVPQLGNAGKKTSVKVLAPPGTSWGDVARNTEKIQTLATYTENSGRDWTLIKPPVNIDSKRVSVRFAEDGGAKSDGVIWVRPGVPDISLGNSRYAQVRIAVDGTHYLKGMAMYKEGLPEGTDLMFNTNKSRDVGKLGAMKPQKGEDNPFGSTVRQRYYTGADGKSHLSPMNIVNEQGDWADWSKSLSSQVLSKQSPALAKRQLDLAQQSSRLNLDEIRGLTNPVVKKYLLEKYADKTDSDAVNLKAAALPRQATHVILPFESMKSGEVYAPQYPNGTRVALVRFPHGGTFEIPEVVVNNKNAEARKTLGTNAPDVIGINPIVAHRLSGADFDGDTVLVIPNNRGDLKTSPPLKGLEKFDPQSEYPPYDGMKTIDGGTYNAASRKVEYGDSKPAKSIKQQKMGDVSNLITDMTIKGASAEEIARAVRHSMVVIDSEKHALNYRQSYIDNNIPGLKAKYQGRGSSGRLAGASTIVSRASSKLLVPERKLRKASEGGPINPTTGEKVFVRTDRSFVGPDGKTHFLSTKTTKLAEASDARRLVSGVSGTPIENIYAAHSNALKDLANQARKDSLHVGNMPYSPSAHKAFASEVKSLDAKLDLAFRNKPLERQAQIIGKAIVAAKLKDNPHLDEDGLKKLNGQALVAARVKVGAEKHLIDITPEEWRAIQAGAISTKKLSDILQNSDIEKLRKLATPRAALTMTPSKVAIAKARLDSGYTLDEVATSLGISVSTLNAALKPKE
jgi:hypothetical protein